MQNLHAFDGQKLRIQMAQLARQVLPRRVKMQFMLFTTVLVFNYFQIRPEKIAYHSNTCYN